MDDYNCEMRLLGEQEMDEVAGGFIQLLGIIASASLTYKQSYETANFYGANDLGTWLGGEVYDFMYSY